MRDTSSEPGGSRDQKQPCRDDDGSDDLRSMLTVRREAFHGDGCRYDRQHAHIHDSETQEDRHQTGTAITAVEAEAQAVSPGGAGVRR